MNFSKLIYKKDIMPKSNKWNVLGIFFDPLDDYRRVENTKY